MSRTIYASDQRVESRIPVYTRGIIADELVAELDAVRRGAGMTLDQVAAQIEISRPQLSNARMGRFGLSIAAAERLMGWRAQPQPIRQMALL